MSRGPVVYTLPPGTTPQQPNDVIQSAVWNAAMDDIANTFNTIQPVEYGGTGSATTAGAPFPVKVTSTDNAIVRFDGTTGSQQNSLVTISDTGLVSSPVDIQSTDGTDAAFLSGGNTGKARAVLGQEGGSVYLVEYDRATGIMNFKQGVGEGTATSKATLTSAGVFTTLNSGDISSTDGTDAAKLSGGNSAKARLVLGSEGASVYTAEYDRGSGSLLFKQGATEAGATTKLTLTAAGSLTTASNLASTGTLTAGGAATFSSGAAVTGTLSASGLTTLSAGANVTGTLAVTGAGSYSTNLSVGGTATVTGAASLNGGAAVTGTLSASGLTTLSAGANVTGTLAVTGAGTFTGNLTALPGLMYGRGNILGTVSQSAGVPTGAAFEYALNGAGSYLRFPDGTQICWLRVTFTSIAITTAYGSLFQGGADVNRNFPAAFAAIPSTEISVTGNGNKLIMARQNPTTTTAWGAWAPVAAVSGTVNVEAEFIAIGRWY